MSLVIEPSDVLTFHRPLTNITQEILLVKNPHPGPVIFKVKTTAPKQYCVRPNAGKIAGHGEVEVQVNLQPFKTDPPLDFRCRDKFLVQSAQVESHDYDSTPVTDIWTRIETQDKGAIHQHKIKCSFDSVRPQESNVPTTTQAPLYTGPDKIEVTSLPEQDNPAYSDDPTTERSTGNDTTTGPTDSIDSQQRVEQQQPQGPKLELTEEPQAANSLTTAPASTTTPATSIPSTNTDSAVELSKHSPPTDRSIDKERTISENTDTKEQHLRFELAEAQKLITRLEQELDHSKQTLNGLRLRQTTNPIKDGARKLPSSVQPLDAVHQHLAQLQKSHPVEGYPPQVVAIICGVIFLFTYLFL
ncbi:hypothetical protein [Absidia glauca]|uniref:MSP domain-containing protein n=1 Tax=Absidia glauca TaxID=4829 RepID=A0A170AMT0_ABSGL|nr:hypothetical protein [Absidia glauca]